jgi:uncharacterized protein (TIGR02118 family)
MVKVFAFIPRRQDISCEYFHAYWRDVHGPMARRVVTIRKYVQSHTIRSGVAGLPPTIYDGVVELWFDDFDVALAIGDDPGYVDYAKADEPNFIDQSCMTSLLCSEATVLAGPVLAESMSEFKSILLVANALGDSWLASELAPAAMDLPGVQRVTMGKAIGDDVVGKPVYDAVVELSWPDLADHDRAWASTFGDQVRDLVRARSDLGRTCALVAESIDCAIMGRNIDV